MEYDWRQEIMILLDRVHDQRVLRRVWKILLDAVR